MGSPTPATIRPPGWMRCHRSNRSESGSTSIESRRPKTGTRRRYEHHPGNGWLQTRPSASVPRGNPLRLLESDGSVEPDARATERRGVRSPVLPEEVHGTGDGTDVLR